MKTFAIVAVVIVAIAALYGPKAAPRINHSWQNMKKDAPRMNDWFTPPQKPGDTTPPVTSRVQSWETFEIEIRPSKYEITVEHSEGTVTYPADPRRTHVNVPTYGWKDGSRWVKILYDPRDPKSKEDIERIDW
jgi:hypothetical protein